MKINGSPEKKSSAVNNCDFDHILFKYLAILYTVFSILAFILFLIALILRNINNTSIGLFLPLSAFLILLCLSCGITLNLFFRSLKNKPSHGFVKWWTKIFALPRITSIVAVVLIELSITMVVIIISLNTKLVSRAYIGSTPGIFIILSSSITSLIIFCRYDKRFSNLLNSIRKVSMQEILFFIATLVGCILIGFFLSQQLITAIYRDVEIIIEAQLVINFVQKIFIVLFTNIIFLLISFLPSHFHLSGFLFTQKQRHDELNLQRKNKQNIFNYPIFTSLLLSTIFVVLFLVFFQVNYGTNDDIQMISLLSGYFGGTPSAFTLFSNVILGFFFSLLYTLKESINWVTLFYFFISFLSIWSLIYCCLLLKKSKIYIAFCLLLVLLYNGYFLSNFTFTTIATNACLAGGCLFLSSLNSKSRFLQVFSIGLIWIGSLIRFDSFALIFFLFVPFVLFNIRQLITKNSILMVLCTSILLFGCYALNLILLNANSNWSEYSRYVKIRHEIIDTPRLTNFSIGYPTLEYISWSQNDLSSFVNHITLDKNVFSKENLQSLLNQLPNWRLSLPKIMQEITKYSATGIPKVFLLLSCSVFLLFLLLNNNVRLLLSTLLSSVVLWGIVFFLAWGYKIPERIIVPLFMTFSLTTLLMVGWTQNQETRILIEKRESKFVLPVGFLLVLSTILAVCLLISQPYWSLRSVREKPDLYEKTNSDITSLINRGEIQKDALIISAGDGYPLQLMDPLQMDFPSVQVLPLGWNAFSPAFNAVLENYEIESLTNALISRTDLYIVSRQDLIPIVVRFYKEHESLTIVVKQIYTLGGSAYNEGLTNSLILYQLEKIN